MIDLIGLIWSGLVSGCQYAIGAIGLVLIFKSCKVVNFAHGNIAGLAAFIIYGMTLEDPAIGNWTLGVLYAILAVIVLAAVVYIFIMPIVFESDITSTIATLGAGLVIQGITQVVYGADIVALDLPIPEWRYDLGPIVFTSYNVLVFSVTILTIAILFFAIDKSKIGVAFRAVSANPFASQVCGLNLNKIQLISWVCAGVVSAIAAILIVPTTFLSTTSVASFMLLAFVAAVVGGFNSITGAVVGGLLIGVLNNLFAFYIGSELQNTYMVIVILIVLNFFPNGLMGTGGGISRV